MDQICPKVLLVLTQLGIQTSSSSTLPISFLSVKVSISVVLYLKQTVRFWVSQNMISTSELESWEARSCKSNFSLDISPNSSSFFSKTTAVNSCIKFWIDGFILLPYSYSEESLVLFLTLSRMLPSRFPSTTFSLKKAFQFWIELLYVQSVISVPPWQKIAQ